MPKKINFFTPVSIPKQEDKILCDSNILTLGSCFSDNIGNKLSGHFFNALVNPFGTIFNPISIFNLLERSVSGKYVEDSDLNKIGSRYFHYDFHTSFDHTNAKHALDEINMSIANVKTFLSKADYLIITFGTCIVYKLKTTDQIVSNCHKVPNHNFSKEVLSIEDAEGYMEDTLSKIKMINPKIKLILTVSPVRHTKEGIIENSLSKSRLIDLSHRVVQKHKDASYFPAYELMMDELRDYRFYEWDLIHPNQQAIDIIWDRFMNTYLDERAIQKVHDINELNRATNHRPFDPESDEHQKFKNNQLKKLGDLEKKYPEVNFQPIIQFFKA